MLSKILLIGIIIALVANVLHKFDIFKNVPTINDKFADCKYLKQDIPSPEDMTFYNETTIIVGSGNFHKQYILGNTELYQSDIYAIVNTHRKDYQVLKLEIQNFPKDIALNIHGIYVKHEEDRKYLYVINHAFQYGGERIEIFLITSKLKLVHIHSIQISDEYMGVLNDLIVVSNTRLLATKSFPIRFPKEGRQAASIQDKIYSFFVLLSGQAKTTVIDCTFDSTNKTIIPECKELTNANGLMLNGITWNNQNVVWIADTLAKTINEYQLTKNGLNFSRVIDIVHGPDNIEFIKEQNILSIGLLPKLYNFATLNKFLSEIQIVDRQSVLEYWGSFGIYNLTSNELEILVQNRYLPKGLSAGIKSGQNLFLGSWCDISVMVCKSLQ